MQSKHFRNPWDHPKSRPPFPGDLAGSLPACLLQSLASPAHLPTKLDGICKSYSQRNVKHYVEKVLICLCKRKACCLNIYWINAHLGICSGLPSSKKKRNARIKPRHIDTPSFCRIIFVFIQKRLHSIEKVKYWFLHLHPIWPTLLISLILTGFSPRFPG